MRAVIVSRSSGMKEFEDRPADDIGRRPAEMALRRDRHVCDAAFGVQQQHRVGAVFHERAKPFLAGAQRLLGQLPLLLLGAQRQRVADRPLERLDRQMGLAQIVRGAGLHRLDGDFLGAAAGEHDHRCRHAVLADFAQQRETVARPEPVVDERDVVRLGGQSA